MDTARFTCRGPAIKAEAGKVVERMGCGQSLDAVIEDAERAVQNGTMKPGKHVLECPCELKRPFTVWIDPKE